MFVNRPNQLRSNFVGDEKSNQFFYDGKTFSLLSQKSYVYTTKPVPASIDGVLAAIRANYNIEGEETDFQL